MGDLRPCNISSERATQNKQDGIIYNCQKQSVHKLWPIKYHWFTENFPKTKICYFLAVCKFVQMCTETSQRISQATVKQREDVVTDLKKRCMMTSRHFHSWNFFCVFRSLPPCCSQSVKHLTHHIAAVSCSIIAAMSSYSGIFWILCTCLIMLHSIPLLISFHSVQGDPGWEWAGPKLPRGPGTDCPAPGCVRGIRLTSMSVQSVSSSLGSHNTPGWTSLHFTVMACSLVLRPSAVVCKSLVSKSTVVIQHWPIRTSQMTSPQFWLVIFRFSSSVRWQMTCKPR